MWQHRPCRIGLNVVYTVQLGCWRKWCWLIAVLYSATEGVVLMWAEHLGQKWVDEPPAWSMLPVLDLVGETTLKMKWLSSPSLLWLSEGRQLWWECELYSRILSPQKYSPRKVWRTLIAVFIVNPINIYKAWSLTFPQHCSRKLLKVSNHTCWDAKLETCVCFSRFCFSFLLLKKPKKWQKHQTLVSKPCGS